MPCMILVDCYALSLVATHDVPSGFTTCTVMVLRVASLSLRAAGEGCFGP